VAWALWATTVAQATFGFALGVRTGLDLRGFFAEYVVAMALGAIAFASVGVLIVSRQPLNPIGALFCLLGIGFGTGWMTEYAHLGLVVAPGAAPGADIVNWINRWLWMPLLAGVAVFLPLIFPTGSLLSPRWRLVAWAGALAAATMGVAFAIAPGPVDASQPDVPNPFSPAWAPLVLPVLTPVALALAAGSLAGGISATVVRFRHAHEHEREREQLKWFAYAVGVLLVALVGPLLVGFPRATDDTLLSGIALSIGFPAIPVATGIAILRYRLFDIDQLISRTLLYVALTACVVGAYAFIVGYLGTLLRSPDSLAISLVATGAVAVIFQPLREQLHRGVTRLLYGRRHEPYTVLSGLDRRLASTLAPETVLPIMVSEVRSALRLSWVAISVRATDGQELLHAAEGEGGYMVLELPLQYQGEQVGVLRLGPRAPGEELAAADLRLLQDMAMHAGAAVHAVRLTAELQRSRERLVLAREDERRRLRRDLHDELAPTLAGLGLVAAAVDQLIPTDAGRAQTAARTLHEAIRRATGDVRRLAHELRPPALDELGLVEALREHVAHYALASASGAAAVPDIHIDAGAPLPLLPAAVEVAAYRIVHEAIMNVMRHADARSCSVRLSMAGDHALEVEVLDDGVGLPTEARPIGVGMLSMRERAEELGGECRIERLDPTEGGTRVFARLPLGPEAGRA
jgi:signal transduction histidine kinase